MQPFPVAEPAGREIELIEPGKLIFSGPTKKRPALESLLLKNQYRLIQPRERPDGTLPDPAHGLPSYTDPITAEKAGAPNSGHTPGTLHPSHLRFVVQAGDHKKAKICKESACEHVGQTELRQNPLEKHIGQPYEPDARITFVTCEWARPDQIPQARFIAEGCGWTLRAVINQGKSVVYDYPEDPAITSIKRELDVLREMVGLPPRIEGAAANTPAWAMQSGSHSAQLARQANSLPWNPAGGVLQSGDFLVTQNGTPNMSVNIAGGVPGGRILVPRAGVKYAGLYYGYNDASVNLTGFTAPGSNSWISTVFAQAEDTAYGDASTVFQLGFVTGSSAPSPVAPSLAVSQMALANIAIASTTTSITTGLISNVVPTATISASGIVLARKWYSPGSVQSYATSPSAWVYPDTTNLAVSFVAPVSGSVWVRAFGGQIQNNTNGNIMSGVNTAASGAPPAAQNLGNIGNFSGGEDTQPPYQFSGPLTGLTPGNTYTAYLAVYLTTAPNGFLYVSNSTAPSAGPLGITVETY